MRTCALTTVRICVVMCVCAGKQVSEDEVDDIIEKGEADNIFQTALQIDKVSVCTRCCGAYTWACVHLCG